MGKEILLKIHESYRWVVAVCDKNVFGRILKESPKRLDVSGEFFKGSEMSLDEARDKIVFCAREDATFNFVGEKSVGLAKSMGIVKEEGIMTIEGVPFALVLL